MLKKLIRHLVRGNLHGSRQVRPPPSGPAANFTQERANTAFKEAVEQIERGHLEPAAGLLNEAIELNPAFAEAHFRLGWLYGQKGAVEDAADCHELAIHFDPGHAQAHMALAALRKTQGRHAEAVELYQRAAELVPSDAATHTNLCLALHEMGSYDAARRHGERAIAIDPKLPEAHHNLGLVLRELGEPSLAVKHFETALDLRPRAEIAAGLAHAFRDLGRLNEAIVNYDRALRLKPDLGDAVINRAYAFLFKEDYATGWEEYDNRFVATATPRRDFGPPQWSGQALQGKTILVHAEQGLGDEIMFASCLPDILAQADRVIVECSTRLAPLFQRSFPEAVVRGGEKEDSTDWVAQFAPVHFQSPIGSLPRWSRPDRTAFPRDGAYLHADSQGIKEWRERLRVGDRLLVGLSWRGGGTKTRGHLRSVPLALLIPLLLQDAAFVSLQHGVQPGELDAAGGRLRLFSEVTESPDQLAALIMALDLIISVDNTTAQLAGALGQTVWVMLSASPEWRYGIKGETMPWYPSARLFRQGGDRRWEPVVQSISDTLEHWRGNAGSGSDALR